MGVMRYSHCSAAHGDDLYVFGGYRGLKETLDVVQKFNTRTQQWTFVRPMPEPMAGMACASFLDNILLIPKFSTSMFIYNVQSDTWSESSTKLPQMMQHIAAGILAD